MNDPTKGPSLSQLLGQSAGGALAGLVGLGGVTTEASTAELVQALLRSHSVIDQIADESGFLVQYQETGHAKDASRARILKSLHTRYAALTGILDISYRDSDPLLATKIVNRAVELLDETYKNITDANVMLKQDSLSKSIDALREETDRLSGEMVAFQKKYGVLDITSAAQQNSQAIAQLQAQIYAKQVDLELRRKVLPEIDPSIVQAKNEIAELQKLVDSLQTGPVASQPEPYLRVLSRRYLSNTSR